MKPDGCHVLGMIGLDTIETHLCFMLIMKTDLSCHDERSVIKQLALLSAVEPGENIRASKYSVAKLNLIHFNKYCFFF